MDIITPTNAVLNNGSITLTTKPGSGNDLFVADTGTISGADQIDGGAGVNTFKSYVTTATTLPSLKNIQILDYAGTVTDTAVDLSLSTKAATGIANVVFEDASLLNTKTITTTTGQSLSLATGASNVATAGVITWAGSTTDTSLNLTLNGFQGAAASPAGLTITGASATTLNIVSSGAANATGTFTGPTSVTKHVITGDKALTYALAAADAAKVTTIDAKDASGGVKVDVSAGTQAAAFAFTGGSGNESLKLTKASLQKLTSGAQLDAGTGKDTLAISDAKYTLVAADYKALNAAKGFEVLAIDGTGGTSSVDASLLTGIKEFAVSAGTNVISSIATGSTLDILAATTKTTVSGNVGDLVRDLKISIGTDQSTTGISNSALDVSGLTDVTITASQKANTPAITHAFGTLTNSDMTAFKIVGNAGLTIVLANGVAAGSAVNGKDATGMLTITGSNFGDTIVGGSAGDSITGGTGADKLTGGAGANTFVFATGASGAVSDTVFDTITDWTAGAGNKIDDGAVTLSAGATIGGVTVSAKGLVTAGAATLADFITAVKTENSSTAGLSYIYNDGTDSYLFVSDGVAANTNDLLVKITGVKAVTGLTFDTGDISAIA